MMITRKVLEEFHYAVDGKDPRRLRAGRRYQFKRDDAARFESEGRIAGAELPPMIAGGVMTLPAAKAKRKRKAK
jgi:hypothetical protein